MIAPFARLAEAPAETAGVNTVIATASGAPAFQAYRVDYRTIGGLEKTRLGLVARINPFKIEDPDVVPVVDAEPARIDDALAALRAHGLKSGLVIAGYEDAQFEVERILAQDTVTSPFVHSLRGETHTVWPVSGERAVNELVRFFAAKKCFPFDGIEHFKAARRFRDEARDAATPEEDLYPLALLVNVFDFGVNFGSYAYMLPPRAGFNVNRFVANCDENFTLQTYPWNTDNERDHAQREFQEDLRIHGTTEITVGAALRDERQFFLFTLKDGIDKGSLLPLDTPAPLQAFSVMHLRHFFVERSYGESDSAWGAATIFADADEALAALDARGGAVFFVSPPNKRALMSLADARRRLPPASVRINPAVPDGLFAERIAAVGPRR